MRRAASSKSILDEKDELLLTLLQENAELPLSKLGEALGLTKMGVSNRIKNLKKAGILEGAHYRVNPMAVGQDYLMICQVSCARPGLGQEKIAAQIANIAGVQAVYLNFGTWDIMFLARRRDKESAKQLLYEVSKIPGIRNTLTTIPHTIFKESLALSFNSHGL
jgi:DNA-binding Lrp family transcriptional regulator